MSTNFTANWNYPCAVRFGIGRLKDLPTLCSELGMKKPLLVTDPGLARLPIVDEAVTINKKAGLPTGVFSEVKPNPVGQNVDDGVAAFKKGGHDGVISFGGGSALDVGKAVALMVGQKRPLWDFEDIDDWCNRVDEKGIAPHLAVPTTSGTGSEVGRSSVITDEAAKRKKVIFHPRMQPWRALCDPELTVGLPPKLTATTGMDALSHNLEAFCTSYFHPMGDGVAVEGMRLVDEALLTAYKNGKDLDARAKMMAASAMGATAFQKGLGAMHSIGHSVGAMFDTHHGETMATLMPYVLLFNREMIQDKLERLARYLDLPTPGFDGVLEWVLYLRSELKIPHTLKDLGVQGDKLDALAEKSVNDPTAGSNPVPLTVANLRSLIQKAYDGTL
ncbi:MAG: iron-containing alcohol dehydrogenase [Pseudomonadota bacterium]